MKLTEYHLSEYSKYLLSEVKMLYLVLCETYET